MKYLTAQLALIFLITYQSFSQASSNESYLPKEQEQVILDVEKILAGKSWDPDKSANELILTVNKYIEIKKADLSNFEKLHEFLSLLVSKPPFKEKGTTVADMALHIYNHQFDFPHDGNYCPGRDDFSCMWISRFIEKYQLKFRSLPRLLAWGSKNYPGRELYPDGQISEVGPEILGVKMELEEIPAKLSARCCANYISYARWNVNLWTRDNQLVRISLPAVDDFNYPQRFNFAIWPRTPEVRFYAAYDNVFMTTLDERGRSFWKASKDLKQWTLLGVDYRDYRMLFQHKRHLAPLSRPKATYPREENRKLRLFVDKNMKPYLEKLGTYYWEVYEL